MSNKAGGSNNQNNPVNRSDRIYKIGYIDEGLVLDHLPPKTALKIISVLGLKDTSKGLVTLAMNLDTNKHPSGKKDLIKIERKMLTEDELNKVALIAPDAVVNVIINSKVARKFKVVIPAVIEGAVKCGNPNCITHLTPGLSRFYKDGERLKCAYCEKNFDLDEIGIL